MAVRRPVLSVTEMSSAIKNKKRGRPLDTTSTAAEIELALNRKKALDSELLHLERQIYALETSYLENTAQLGDLIRGWNENFTSPTSPGGPGGSTTIKKKRKIYDYERIFSGSSVSAMKNPEFHAMASSANTQHSNSNTTTTLPPRNSASAQSGNLEYLDQEMDVTPLDLDADAMTKKKPEKKTPDSMKKKSAPRPPKAAKGPANNWMDDPNSLASFDPYADGQ